MKDTAPPDEGKWTMGKVLKHLHQPLEAMPSVIAVLRHSLTFGAIRTSLRTFSPH